jgi:hypothetical protein
MAVNLLDKGKSALENVSEQYLPMIVHWLELLADAKDNCEIEPEELWLLATGELEGMNQEMSEAEEIDDWRTYLDEL